jgi:uncharacterized membrane protein
MSGRDAGEATIRIGTALLGAALAVAVLRALRRRRAAWIRQGRYEDREARRQIVVDQDRTRVYWLCREPARLAAALDPAVRAETIDDTWSRWTVPTPDGVPRLLTVEMVGDIPELLLAWRAGNGWLPHEGTIRLAAAGTGRTEVSVTVRYRWSTQWAADAGVSADPVDGYLAGALERVAGAARAAAAP